MIPANERICKCCNMKVVENEYHFILVCPGYKDIRKKKFLKQYYCHWPSLNKFDSLMMSNSAQILLNTAKYLYYASKYRQEELNQQES